MGCVTKTILKKSIILLLSLLILSPAIARAELMYVMDTLAITMRSGPGIEFRVLASLKTGDKVDVLEQSGDWVMVRLSDDRKGWVLARYVSPEKPSYMLVEALTAQAQSRKEKLETLELENRELKKENQTLSSNLQRVEKNYSALKEGAQEYLALKGEHKKVLTMLEAFQIENDDLTAENNALKSAQNMQWFLIGFGVTISVGLLGFILGRFRRKPKSDISFSLR